MFQRILLLSVVSLRMGVVMVDVGMWQGGREASVPGEGDAHDVGTHVELPANLGKCEEGGGAVEPVNRITAPLTAGGEIRPCFLEQPPRKAEVRGLPRHAVAVKACHDAAAVAVAGGRCAEFVFHLQVQSIAA
jgi:hypothetical protein